MDKKVRIPVNSSPRPEGAGVVGHVEMLPLDSVRPNDWNPNQLTPFAQESLKRGIRNDGWLSSQALLIWASDENDERKMIIIDGEHRWHAAKSLGYVTGPMVRLEGLSEPAAKALTVKMDAKRGTFAVDKLGELLREIQYNFDVPDLSLEMGIGEQELMKMLADDPSLRLDTSALEDMGKSKPPPSVLDEPGAETPDEEDGEEAPPRVVQLFIPADQYEKFTEDLERAQQLLGAENPSQTVQFALGLVEGS